MQHSAHVESTYGISGDLYDKILNFQGGRCYICGNRPGKKRLATDHRHSDGLVRGLLCTNCNRNVLGKLKEDKAKLMRAVDYLDKPPAPVAMVEPEDWVDIDGFPNYQVSTLGRVRSYWTRGGRSTVCESPTLLKRLNNGNGYLQVTLVRDGVKYKRHIHRLVADAFLVSPGADVVEVCHIDGDKQNNRACNLYWGTHSENCDDRTRHGRQNTAKLTPQDVRSIRSRKHDTVADLAIEFGVSTSTVWNVLSGKTWKWVV